jgi:hypothetical protein
MIFHSRSKLQEDEAHEFCIAVQREFAVRAHYFKPQTVQEQRWAMAGICNICQFETVAELISEGLANV